MKFVGQKLWVSIRFWSRFPTSFFLDFGLSIGNPLSFKFQFWNRFVKCCLALYSIEHLLACPLVRLTTLNLLVRILCVCVGSCLSSGLHINPTQSKLCTQPRSHAGTHRLSPTQALIDSCWLYTYCLVTFLFSTLPPKNSLLIFYVIYKKVNKRVNKKVKRESWEREFSPKNHNLVQ